MKPISIKDTPAGSANYQLEDGRIFRIILKVLTPESQFATADYLDLETTGYEITKSGAFVVDTRYGEPIMLRVQRAKMPLANMRAGLDSAQPSWIKQKLSEDPEQRTAALEGIKASKKLPAEAEEGDLVQVDGELYVWTLGAYEALRRARLQELASPQKAPAQEMSPALLASLRP